MIQQNDKLAAEIRNIQQKHKKQEQSLKEKLRALETRAKSFMQLQLRVSSLSNSEISSVSLLSNDSAYLIDD